MIPQPQSQRQPLLPLPCGHAAFPEIGHMLLDKQWKGQLSGGLTLEIVDGTHRYTLDHTLPGA